MYNQNTTSNVVQEPKQNQREKLKTGETIFDFKNPLRKQRSFDFHNVEVSK